MHAPLRASITDDLASSHVPFAAALRGALPAGLAPQLVEDFLAAASRELEELRARWPAAPSPALGFWSVAEERLARESRLATALPRFRAGDLFLAWWASVDARLGIVAFWEVFRADVTAVLARFPASEHDELWQAVQVKLFASGSAAGLASYSGFGFLQNWLRVLVTRTCLDAQRAARRRRTIDLESAGHDDDAPLVALIVPAAACAGAIDRARLTAAIRGSFARALARLDARQRTYLRMATIDELTLEQLAATFRVSRATVARVLAGARAALRDATRRDVRTHLNVGEDTLRSLVRDLETQVDMSLTRILAEPPPARSAETALHKRRPEKA